MRTHHAICSIDPMPMQFGAVVRNVPARTVTRAIGAARDAREWVLGDVFYRRAGTGTQRMHCGEWVKSPASPEWLDARAQRIAPRP